MSIDQKKLNEKAMWISSDADRLRSLLEENRRSEAVGLLRWIADECRELADTLERAQ